MTIGAIRKYDLCPVCYNTVIVDYCDYMEGRVLLEEQRHCRDHYLFSYAYGYWTEVINGVESYGSYADTPINNGENKSSVL